MTSPHENVLKKWEEHEIEHKLSFLQGLTSKKKDLKLKVSVEVILKRHLEETVVKDFFNALEHCISHKDFNRAQMFYSKCENPEVRTIARVAFSVYRMNSGEYPTPKSLKNQKELVSKIMKSGSDFSRAIITDFRSVNLLSL